MSSRSTNPEPDQPTSATENRREETEGTVPPPEGGTKLRATTPTIIPANQPSEAASEATSAFPDQPGSESLAIGSLLGPYELLEKLGQGGMGAVYKARHQHLDMLVAIKVLPLQLTQQADSVARFRREMKAVGRIRHANIVQAMDAGEINGTQYLAMEYIEGADLAKLVATKGVFSVANACKAIKQAAQALSAAHAAGLVHRDIKPSNLLLAKSGQIKILDLGLALLGEEGGQTANVTAHGQTFGTPDYMAPEQWADSHAVDARTDLYALGCTLYFLLVGRSPYSDDKHLTPFNKMNGHVNEPIPDLKAARADAPDNIAAIYRKLLAKDPGQRYQTAAELVEALATLASAKKENTGADVSGSHAAIAASALTEQSAEDYGTSPERADATLLSAGAVVGEESTSAGPRRKPPSGRRRWLALSSVIAVSLAIGLAVMLFSRGKIKPDAEAESSTQFPSTNAAAESSETKAADRDLSVEDGKPVRLEPSATTQNGLPTETARSHLLGFDRDTIATVSFPFDFHEPFTIECYVTIDELPGQKARLWELNGPERLDLVIGKSSQWSLTNARNISFLTAPAVAGKRTHVAVVYTGTEFVQYLDGQHQGSGRAREFPQHEPKAADAPTLFAIGDTQFNGSVEEFRVSRGARYTAHFDPAIQIESDADTVLLWRLDEGQGKILTDASGNKHHGKVLGAKWRPIERKRSEQPASWHNWPADAPQPAIAPFDAVQAQKYQEEWAEYLKVPVEYENSLGMKFRLIPPGEFTMGSTQEEVDEALKFLAPNATHDQECVKSEVPQHKVILTQPVYVGVTEVTQSQYEKVMGTNPSHFSASGPGKDVVAGLETDNHPVERVSWHDAAEFSAKLSQQEQFKPFYFRAGGTITPLEGTGYRLPSEAEWEFACRAGTTTKYWIGDRDDQLVRAGWFNGNSGGRTHAVGELKSNPFGLSDIHGNVWEWVEDTWDPAYYARFTEEAALNPIASSSAGSQNVLRGGHWHLLASNCLSSARNAIGPGGVYGNVGFRLVLVVDAVRQALKTTGPALPKPSDPDATTTPTTSEVKSKAAGWHGWPADAPKPAIAPFDADEAKQHQEAWAEYLKVPVEYENSLGMKFRLIPPGEYLRGSTPEEIEGSLQQLDPNYERGRGYVRSEAPRHTVILTRPVYFGIHEVTQADFEKVLAKTPSHFAQTGSNKVFVDRIAGLETSRHPVEGVNWNDAVEFCTALTLQERLSDDNLAARRDGQGYQLPTEAEWEFAHRAGATAIFGTGDTEVELLQAAWIGNNSGGRTHAVGELNRNPFGLFDTLGNVQEWMQDAWEPTTYSQFDSQPAIDLLVPPAAGPERVVRGGDWTKPPSLCRASSRTASPPEFSKQNIGFRVTLAVDAVRQVLKVTGPALPQPADDADAIDYAAERKAAEWVRSVQGTLSLIDAAGASLAMDGDKLPSEKFAIGAIELRFGENSVEDDLQHLARCRRLSMLSTGGDKFAGHGLAHLAPVKSLRQLQLSGRRFTNEGLATLADLTQVQYLFLGEMELVTDDGLAPIARMTGLARVRFDKLPQITDDGLRHLEQLPALFEVRFTSCPRLTDTGMRQLFTAQPNLQIVDFQIASDAPAGSLTLKTLELLPKLKEVVASVDQLTEEGILTLGRLPELHTLGLHGPLNDEAASRIARLSGLRTLMLSDFSQTAETLAAWQALATLQELEVILVFGTTPLNMDDAGLKSLAAAPKLKFIIMPRPKNLTDAGIDAFRKLRPDVRLEIGGRVYEPIKATGG